MSDNVTLVKIIETSNEPHWVISTIFGSLFVVGLILLFWGAQKDNRTPLYLGFACIFVSALTLFLQSDTLRELLVALAAVFATVIAITSLYVSNKNREDTNKRIESEKGEAFKKEKFNQKRWASEVISEWGIQILRELFIAARFADDMSTLKENIIETRSKLSVTVAEGIRISYILEDLRENSLVPDSNRQELVRSFKAVDASLRDFIDHLFSFELPSQDVRSVEVLANRAASVTSTIKNLLYVASQIAFL